MDKNGKLAVNIPWTNTTYNAATTSAAGLMSASDKAKLDGIAAGANNYSLPLASSLTRGGVKIGYTQSGKNYPVQLSSEKMYVNVPWTDTTYTFTNKNATLAWGTKSTIATVGGTDITVTMPANPNTDTHYNAYLYATGSSGTAHAATTNGNTYLRLIENYTARSSIKVAGAGLTTVSSDGSGNITISTLNGTNAGDANTPIYLNGGTFTACTSLDLNTTGNAATATKATQDGDGAVISSTYLKLAGGTMTGTIVTPGNDSVVIRPAKNNYDQIGSSSYKFWQIYATTFYGTLSGNASTATKLATARTIRTNLSSTTAPSFDGTANITPGVTGILPITNGGTGGTTAADARIKLGAVNMVTKTVTLSTYNWSSNTQTVNVTGVTASNTILVGYSPESYEAYSDAAIRCVGQDNNTLTFSCESKPSVNVSVNVVILN